MCLLIVLSVGIFRRWRAVAKHVNSSLVDAKLTFPEHKVVYDWIPSELCAKSETSLSQLLKYKYMISIEGNDVSSGLKVRQDCLPNWIF
jgi:hypothetical protein